MVAVCTEYTTLCCRSRAFVENEYSKRYAVDVYKQKHDGVDVTDISQKGNKTKTSIQSKQMRR